MNPSALRVWTKYSQVQCRTARIRASLVVAASHRNYATHLDFGGRSKLLSDSMASKQRGSELKHDHVGPFQLGISPSTIGKGEKFRKWSELDTAGRVMRTTARTTNFGVILLGAGISILLVYSLTSELFSKNSPTVLYGEACEQIKANKKIERYLNPPLTFHNNPPSLVRPRHRNRHVTSRVMVDAHGNEHMIMKFFIQGRPEGEHAPSDDNSYLQSLQGWVNATGTSITDISFDETVDWTKEKAKLLWDKSVNIFKYLSGTPVSPPSLPILPSPESSTMAGEEKVGWGFAGIFSSLKGGKRSTTERASASPHRLFTEGEVHADFVKDQDGYFQCRYILVDIPSTRDPHPIRIFVERQPGVRDNEPVVRWIS